MTTYKKRLKDNNGNTIYPDVGLNLDDVIYGDNPEEEVTPEPWVDTSEILDGAITDDKIDWTTFSEIYDNIVTNSGKTYTITTPGIYLAWGISSSPTTGSAPAVIISMAGTVKAKAISVNSNGLWISATAVAVGVLNAGDTIIISQEQADSVDSRSSVGMCLIQRV